MSRTWAYTCKGWQLKPTLTVSTSVSERSMDFPISIISERNLVDGKETVQNRFVVEGNYKYKFNNGFIAISAPHAACMNFVNALEKIPCIIAQDEERTAKLKADVPQLEAIVAKSWGKEDKLKQLKYDLAALDRKITATHCSQAR